VQVINGTEGTASTEFDYDTYKILVRFMANPKNKRSITVLSPKEFHTQYARATHASDDIEFALDEQIIR
jgi:hypothetical protein